MGKWLSGDTETNDIHLTREKVSLPFGIDRVILLTDTTVTSQRFGVKTLPE